MTHFIVSASRKLTTSHTSSVQSMRRDSIRHSETLGILSILLLCYVILCIDGLSLPFALVTFAVGCLCVLIAENRRRDLLTPFVTFPLFYYPYSTWFAFSSFFSRDQIFTTVLTESIRVAVIGLAAFYAGCKVASVFTTQSYAQSQTAEEDRCPLADLAFWLAASLVIAALVFTAFSGYTTKREINDSETAIVAIGKVALLFMTSYFFFRTAGVFTSTRSTRHIFLVVLLLSAGMYGVMGERDYLMRLGFGTACFWFDRRRTATLPVIIAIAFFAIVAMPVSHAFKALLIRDEAIVYSLQDEELFRGEFSAAGRNLYMLMVHNAQESWNLVLNDICRGSLPLSGYLGFSSSSAWFHTVFRVDHGFAGTSGWGFGLLPQGWVVGRAFGVVTLLGAVGMFLGWAYEMRHTSKYYHAFYVFALCSTIYCLRTDVAGFISQSIRLNAMFLLLLFAFSRMGRLSPSTRNVGSISPQLTEG